MYKIREVFRLLIDSKMSCREIAASLNMGKSTVNDVAKRIKNTELTYSETSTISDTDLLELLQMAQKNKSDKYNELAEQFPYFEKELKRTGVTIKLLWDEYKEKNPGGYGLSQFGYHFQLWRGSTKVSMVKNHKAGDKVYIDYAGKKLSIFDRETKQETFVEVFVATLPSTGYTYAEASLSQKKEELIKSTENALWYFEGVPNAIVPDCLKSAVTTACKYEPEINKSFKAFAKYYQSTVLPARPYSPTDKAAVESSVSRVYQNIFAKMRNKTFYSLTELNKEIFKHLEDYNNKPMQRIGLSRKQLFEQIEKNTLNPLPLDYYTPKTTRILTAGLNYHILLKEDNHYYSVPYKYSRKKVTVEFTDDDVEIMYENVRIASHKRSNQPNKYTTVKEHMSPNHKHYNSWSPEYFISKAEKIGSETVRVIKVTINNASHPEQGYKLCTGILNLATKYSNSKLEMASKKALSVDTYQYSFFKNILKNNQLDVEQLEMFETTPKIHKNIRGNVNKIAKGANNEQ